MANLQVRLNDDIKTQADLLFASLGLDTSTAVRMFLVAAIENGGIPFEVRHRTLNEGVQQAISDSRNRANLNVLIVPQKKPWRRCWRIKPCIRLNLPTK